MTDINKMRQELEDQSASAERLASARASQLEPLFLSMDYAAIREFLNAWESEDSAGSAISKYARTREQVRAAKLY
jgi:hypothetical protein